MSISCGEWIEIQLNTMCNIMYLYFQDMSINIAVTTLYFIPRQCMIDQQKPTESRKTPILLFPMKDCFIFCSKTISVEPKPYLRSIQQKKKKPI